MNKLPQVKAFIKEDLEVLFENTQFKKIPGKSPELKLYNRNGEELESYDISKMDRKELVSLLDVKGIARKAPHDEV